MKKERKFQIDSESALIVIGVALISGVVGYNFGSQIATDNVGRGLEKVWEFDPSLKEHMWESMIQYKKSQK